ncbi:hypothetical protein BT63DRAFT_416072 [Microthyrium microscopicum]|uniref:TFIID subunit TAF5 NTD2 domain-containing protein n=1 Tax=Microthyrium microscopicum TaxID=703497 RepID=A0A6A6U7D5_9PEZI|nr:hypothetical protein BT63DRAFT_416072 [Microthyrium microscopicum]
MSNIPNVPSRSGSIANGPPSAGMNSQQAPPPTPGAAPTQQNLNQIRDQTISADVWAQHHNASLQGLGNAPNRGQSNSPSQRPGFASPNTANMYQFHPAGFSQGQASRPSQGSNQSQNGGRLPAHGRSLSNNGAPTPYQPLSNQRVNTQDGGQPPAKRQQVSGGLFYPSNYPASPRQGTSQNYGQSQSSPQTMPGNNMAPSNRSASGQHWNSSNRGPLQLPDQHMSTENSAHAQHGGFSASQLSSPSRGPSQQQISQAMSSSQLNSQGRAQTQRPTSQGISPNPQMSPHNQAPMQQLSFSGAPPSQMNAQGWEATQQQSFQEPPSGPQFNIPGRAPAQQQSLQAASASQTIAQSWAQIQEQPYQGPLHLPANPRNQAQAQQNTAQDPPYSPQAQVTQNYQAAQLPTSQVTSFSPQLQSPTTQNQRPVQQSSQANFSSPRPIYRNNLPEKRPLNQGAPSLPNFKLQGQLSTPSQHAPSRLSDESSQNRASPSPQLQVPSPTSNFLQENQSHQNSPGGVPGQQRQFQGPASGSQHNAPNRSLVTSNSQTRVFDHHSETQGPAVSGFQPNSSNRGSAQQAAIQSAVSISLPKVHSQVTEQLKSQGSGPSLQTQVQGSSSSSPNLLHRAAQSSPSQSHATTQQPPNQILPTQQQQCPSQGQAQLHSADPNRPYPHSQHRVPAQQLSYQVTPRSRPQSQSQGQAHPNPSNHGQQAAYASRQFNTHPVINTQSKSPPNRPANPAMAPPLPSWNASSTSRTYLSPGPSFSNRQPYYGTGTPGMRQIQRPLAPVVEYQLNPNTVLEYLNKKGYAKTEATLRKESANLEANGTPSVRRARETGGPAYDKAFSILLGFIEDSLEAYRPELYRLLWPIFVHCILDLAADYYPRECEAFYKKHHERFDREHVDELRQLSVITSPEHLASSSLAKLYRENKYRLTLTKMVYAILVQFLENREEDGGDILTKLINSHLKIVEVERAAVGERSLAAMLARKGEEYDQPAEDEGIPGHNPGSANTDPNAPNVLPRLALGPLPMDVDLADDVRAELAEQDEKEPPAPGEDSLVAVWDEKVKKEPTEDAPSRETIPLPPPLARDVAMEVQKVREHRDRFKIDPFTGGTPPGVSVCMYTFHNTHESFNCLDFSGDLLLVAGGTALSYIQVWSLDGSPLIDMSRPDEEKPPSSRRLIGHSGPVFAVSFQPSTEKPKTETDFLKDTHTGPHLLLSASADKTIRLWSLDAWTCLTYFRSHLAPVFDVQWGPYGHYFLTCGADKVARVWSQESIAPLRMFVGHENDVECGAWHPNGAYVFTAGDKTIRMWDIMRGTSLRMFTGHTGNITALECSRDGKTLASADDQGSIFLWDLATGTRIKRMRGHAKGGIWSLSWSVESNLVVSGGADNTVRVWDVAPRAEGSRAADLNKTDGSMSAPPVPSVLPPKKSKKDVVITPDQISCFPTKKSPVKKVMFTRANLCIAGSVFEPEPA